MVNIFSKNIGAKEVSPHFPENSLTWKTPFPDNAGKSVLCVEFHMSLVLVNCSVLLTSLTAATLAL